MSLQYGYQWAATHIRIFKAIWQLRCRSDWMVWSGWVTSFSCANLEKLHLESCLCCLFIRRKQTTWREFRESNTKWLKGWREKGWRETVGHVSKAWKLNVYSLCKQSLRRERDGIKCKYQGGRGIIWVGRRDCSQNRRSGSERRKMYMALWEKFSREWELQDHGAVL